MGREFKISDIKPGMKPARDYKVGDQVVFPKGVPLTEEQVVWLQKHLEKQMKAGSRQEKLADYRKHIVESPEFESFSEDYHSSIDKTRVTFNQVLEADGEVNSEELLESVESVLENCGGVFGNVIMMLQNMEEMDDSTYAHSVNVALLATMLGRKLKMSEEEVRIVSVGGLLHDIGKLKMPEIIIQKPGRLSPEEFKIIQQHPLEGYKLLRNRGLSEDILMCVLQHHERCDGTGYPYNAMGNRINKYAKVVAIANAFEALTSQRIYRDALCPFEAMRILEEERFEKYDIGYLLTFLEYIVEVYVGMDVKLSNGKRGKIVLTNANDLSRPLVRTRDGFVDLSRQKDINIEEVL